MEEGGDAIGGIVLQPVLHGDHHIADGVRIAWLLEGKLREVADAIGDQFATFRGVELSLVVEEFVHIHTLELCDALFLRHLGIELINLLFHIHIDG